ncbi:MAG: hypothetical protein AB1806_20010 [Acidobacteriota bacterium]
MTMTRRHRADERGLSLMEVTIMLGVLSVLTSVLSPVVGNFVADARITKARGDVQTLAVVLARFAYDVGAAPSLADSWSACQLLVGEGTTPSGRGPAVDPWLADAGTDGTALLDAHLVLNAPGYDRRPLRSAGFTSRGWAGPYVSAGIGSDPWGHRYAINVRHLATKSGFDTIVLSAGPNGVVETAFSSMGTAPGGDDIIAVIAGH